MPFFYVGLLSENERDEVKKSYQRIGTGGDGSNFAEKPHVLVMLELLLRSLFMLILPMKEMVVAVLLVLHG